MDIFKEININNITESKIRKDKIHKIIVFAITSTLFLFICLLFGFIIYNSSYFLRSNSFWNFITGKNWNPEKSQFQIGIIILSTFFVLLLALIFSVPISIFSALFICEYLSKKLKARAIGITRLLAGIPSVIFGLFALTQIGPLFIKMGAPSNQNLLLASIILGFMAMPIMISLCISAINSVPAHYRYASAALGFSKSHTSFKVIYKSARLGITSAIIMGLARIIGETMAVIMIAGNSPSMPNFNSGFLGFFFSSVRTLAGTIGIEMLENAGTMHASALYTIGFILFILIIIINLIILSFKNWQVSKIHIVKQKIRKRKINFNFLKKKSKITSFSSTEVRNKLWYKIEHNTYKKIINYTRIFLMLSSTIIMISFTFWVIGVVLFKGIYYIFDFSVAKNQASELLGINSLIIFSLFLSTIILVFTTIAISLPLSLFSAIFLTFYIYKKSLFKKSLTFIIDIIASIPSIIFGLFGLSFLIEFLHMQLSIITAALALSFLVAPLMIKSIQISLEGVDSEFTECSYALGSSKTATIWKIIIPSAIKGIVTSVILSMARIVGESAPIYLTLGTVAMMPSNGFLSSGTTLAVKIYMIFKEGSSTESLNIAYELALVVMLTILVLNFLSAKLGNFFSLDYSKVSLKTFFKEKFKKEYWLKKYWYLFDFFKIKKNKK